MEKFRISYKNGELVGFHRTEEFKDYDDAYYWCVTQNKFGVVYPERANERFAIVLKYIYH